MNPKELDQSYHINKEEFHNYIDNIKKSMKVDFYSTSNPTIIKNPFSSSFPKKFFSKEYSKKNKSYLFFKSCTKFYVKQFYLLFSYMIAYLLFKIYYKKSRAELDNYIAMDVFFLVDNINKDERFNENYFAGLYEILEKYNQNYLFLPRLYGIGKNPFKLIKFFKIINKDKRNFLFEFEILHFKDLFSLFYMISAYPFKSLRLLQKEKSDVDILFNTELINDTANVGFDIFIRYIFSKNISNEKHISKIYSWCEFQAVERSFIYGLKSEKNEIKTYGCQFYLNYETYFNAYVDDLDYIQKTAYDEILVNGEYNILKRKNVKYRAGVSLRYKNIFSLLNKGDAKNIVLLGSYIEDDTRYMIDSISSFDEVLFKNHPAVNIRKFKSLPLNITIVNDNIYTLFENAKVVIATASGTSVEAVSCGISVIIIASKDNLTANPLSEYGKGKIWDIAFSKDDVNKIYNKLTEFRKSNPSEIEEISKWYKDNFFIKPTEENIVKAFELEKE